VKLLRISSGPHSVRRPQNQLRTIEFPERSMAVIKIAEKRDAQDTRVCPASFELTRRI